MEQALTAGFLPSAARSDAAALLRSGSGSRAAGVAHARMACLPVQWSTGSSSTSGNLTARRCSYSCVVPSSTASGNLTVIRGATHSSTTAGYLATSSCAAPSSPAAGNLVISRRSPSCTARSSSSAGSALQALVAASSASSSNPCYSTGASSSSAFSLTGAASSSEAETLFVFAYPCASSCSALLQFTGAASSSEAEPLFVFAYPCASSCSAQLQFTGAASSSEAETLFVFAYPCASSCSVRLQFAGSACSSEAEPLLAGCLAFPCISSSVKECSARESTPMCFLVFPDFCDHDARVDIDTSAAGRGPRFFVIREAISEEAAAGSSEIESPFARCFVVFSEGASSSAVFSAPSRAAAVFFAGAESPSPDANSCSRYFNLLSGSSRRSRSSMDAYLLPFPDSPTDFSSLLLSRRTHYCILSGAAGSWRDKAHKRFDCRCYALSADGKEGKNREFPHANSCSCYSSFLSGSSRRSCSSIPSPDLSRRTNHFILSGAANSWQDKAHKRSGYICNAVANDKSAASLYWENFARVCFLCSVLQRAGYFKLPPPSQTKKDWKELKEVVNKQVRAILLVCCLYVGYLAATGNNEKKFWVDVIDSAMKAYKIVDEVAKLIF